MKLCTYVVFFLDKIRWLGKRNGHVVLVFYFYFWYKRSLYHIPSIYCHLHNLYGLHQFILLQFSYANLTVALKQLINHILYIYVFEVFIIYIVLRWGETKNTFILDVDDENTTCVFACTGTHVAYLNLKLQ